MAVSPVAALASNQTPGLVCAHHHLYSALARGMPAPPADPTSFLEVLELVWWRLDQALDLDMIEWSAKLGALEALEAGTTSIIDHHESPRSIEGSLDTIARACAEVGVRVECAYGVTDRHGPEGAQSGLAENDDFLSSGGRGRVGVHAAFTCSDETLATAADLALEHGVGVHIHVAEGPDDHEAVQRLAELSTDDWLIVHGVNLPSDHGLRGTIVHNPRSNMNNSVGYSAPARFSNPVALGTDGIGADMLEEFRLAFVRAREADLAATPDDSWGWLSTGWDLFPEAATDRVTWSYEDMDPWHLVYTPTIGAVDIDIDGEPALADGRPTRVDADEIRAKAREQARRLHSALADMPYPVGARP
ncbi:MAG: amidohydrolase family protein [Actinomycetia bacterium]|nr:amidohydrolase family protein [Actinomycetes bacterium]